MFRFSFGTRRLRSTATINEEQIDQSNNHHDRMNPKNQKPPKILHHDDGLHNIFNILTDFP